MEGQNNNSVERMNEIESNGTSTDKPSRTLNRGENNVKSDSGVSSQVSQLELQTENASQDVVEISSDDELQIIGVSKEQIEEKAEKNRNNENQQSTSGRASPKDVTCSVCLSEFDDKSFLDKCFHAFCYFCILQWSEIVRTCPLCKTSFNSIIHSVKSIDNYQQHYLSKPDVPASVSQTQSDGRRFRYRTTAAEGSQQQNQRRQGERSESDVCGQRALRRRGHLSAQRNRNVISRERRRTIYSSNLWVQGVTQTGRPRQREISPEFFRANPACSHRLIPWLTRDLRVLLNDEESHVNFVLQIILSLITKVELSSEEFCNHLRPFLFDKTEHFVHEFISFARSPFDVNAYDERAQYNWPDESREQERETPTVFHSHNSGWQTPVPGPSGVSILELSETDWNRDSPVRQSEFASWSPSSSPGPSGLNSPRLVETVTISSGSSQSVSTGHSESDEQTNRASKGKRRQSVSVGDTTTAEETSSMKSRKKSSHRRHRHSQKHKRKDERDNSSKISTSRHSNSLETDSNVPGPSRRVSINSSLSDSTVEIIVLSDSSDSLDSPGSRGDVVRIDLARCRSDKRGSVSRSRTRTTSEGNEKKRLPQKYRHRSRSKRSHSRHQSRSPSGYSNSYSRSDYSWSKRERKEKSRNRSRSCPRSPVSRSRGQSAERRLKSKRRSRSRSRRSDLRSHERHHAKRERHTQSDVRDPSNSDSRTLDLKKGKHDREKRRSQSGTPGGSQSRSKGRSDLKIHSESFEKRKCSRDSHSRSTSPSTTKRGAASSTHSSRSFSRQSKSRSPRRYSRVHSPISRNSRSRSRSERCTQSRLSRSPSLHVTDSSPESRCRARSKSHNEESMVSSALETQKSRSDSSEDIKREIEDLELRITADKKRLLKLLIKQERAKGDGVTVLSEKTGNDPCEEEIKY